MAEAVHDAERLKDLQALPLERKIQITQTRIIEWYQHYNGNVCVSFSGGKDSTVLLHIARQLYPDIPAVFSDTGLEYSAIREFVRTWDNVDIIRPDMNFGQVITTYGYPIIGKEAAEAIYYARRIGPSGERERADNPPQADGTLGQTNLISTSHAANRRTILQGRWGCNATGNDWKLGGQNRRRAEISGALTTGENLNRSRRAGGSETFWKRAEITGRYRNSRKAGVAGPTKSQFNKEKWLPLARDAPFLISHYCCFKMKKSPMHKYQTAHKYKPILATLAEESRVRKQAWIRHGCNAFESKNPMSQPMSFWTEQDVLAYIVKYNVQIASVYGDIVTVGTDGNHYPAVDVTGNVQCNLKCSGCQRTGCVFCGFGAHLEKGETRFQRLAFEEPRKYEFCIGGGEWIDNPFYDPAAPVWDGEWKNWNPKKIWSRNGKGLGLGKVFDICNEMYGKNFIKYD